MGMADHALVVCPLRSPFTLSLSRCDAIEVVEKFKETTTGGGRECRFLRSGFNI